MIFLNKEGKSFSSYPLPDIAQLSTIESININQLNGDIAFVGNSRSWVVELGSSLANSGGVLRGFNPKMTQYESYESFPLPIGTVGKHIQQLTNSDYVIITNDGDSYQISKK